MKTSVIAPNQVLGRSNGACRIAMFPNRQLTTRQPLLRTATNVYKPVVVLTCSLQGIIAEMATEMGLLAAVSARSTGWFTHANCKAGEARPPGGPTLPGHGHRVTSLVDSGRDSQQIHTQHFRRAFPPTLLRVYLSVAHHCCTPPSHSIKTAIVILIHALSRNGLKSVGPCWPRRRHSCHLQRPFVCGSCSRSTQEEEDASRW